MRDAYEVRDTLEPSLRGELCRLWGSSLYQFGEYVPAKLALDEAVELLAEWGPRDREGWSRTMLAGLLPHFEPDLEPALAEISRAVEISASTTTAFGLATALRSAGRSPRSWKGSTRVPRARRGAPRGGEWGSRP